MFLNLFWTIPHLITTKILMPPIYAHIMTMWYTAATTEKIFGERYSLAKKLVKTKKKVNTLKLSLISSFLPQKIPVKALASGPPSFFSPKLVRNVLNLHPHRWPHVQNHCCRPKLAGKIIKKLVTTVLTIKKSYFFVKKNERLARSSIVL